MPSQQEPEYLLSRQVPPGSPLFSSITKLRHLFLLIRSKAVHIPDMPAPMINTAASRWLWQSEHQPVRRLNTRGDIGETDSLLVTDTCGHGLSPPIVNASQLTVTQN